MYVPQISSQPIQFCKVDSSNKTYMVLEESEKAQDLLRQVPIDEMDSYRMKLSTMDHVTVAYRERDGESYAGELSSDPDSLQGIFDGVREIEGIKYTPIISFPMDGIDSRYEDGNVYGTIYSGKNQYGPTYSMEMGGPDRLSCTRKYVGIISSGDKVYLKYHDMRDGGGVPYQKIEQFVPVNCNDHGKSQHKSQFFSVKVKNTGIGSSGDDEILGRIRQDITNAVFKIAENVCPAQT